MELRLEFLCRAGAHRLGEAKGGPREAHSGLAEVSGIAASTNLFAVAVRASEASPCNSASYCNRVQHRERERDRPSKCVYNMHCASLIV